MTEDTNRTQDDGSERQGGQRVPNMVDLLQPCRPWPQEFVELTTDEATAWIEVFNGQSSDKARERNGMIVLGMNQGNLCCAMDPSGRIACQPTLRGRRGLN